MKLEENKKALEIIRQNIKKYRGDLICEFGTREKREEKIAELESDRKVYVADGIEKYKTILTDLAIVKKAIEKNYPTVMILGTSQATGQVYIETQKILEEIGFPFKRNGCCTEVQITFPKLLKVI